MTKRNGWTENNTSIANDMAKRNGWTENNTSIANRKVQHIREAEYIANENKLVTGIFNNDF
jgi:hypothetical protein